MFDMKGISSKMNSKHNECKMKWIQPKLVESERNSNLAQNKFKNEFETKQIGNKMNSKNWINN